MENFEKDFKKYILNALIIFIVFISVTYILMEMRTIDFVTNKTLQRIKSIHNYHIESDINNYFDIITNEINFRNKLIENYTRQMVKDDVDRAVKVANELYDEFHLLLPEKTLQDVIIKSLSNFKTGNKYIFAVDFKGVNQINPVIPRGAFMYNWKDAKGKYMVKKMIEVAKTKGEGFVEYYWFKPDSPNTFIKKVSYIKLFKPFQWCLGEGYYYEDTKIQLQHEILNFIKRLTILKSKDFNYFIFDTNSNRFLIGEKSLKTEYNMERVTKNYLKNIKGNTFRYSINNKNKILFLKYYEQWKWILGVTVDYNSFQKAIALEKHFIKKQYIQNILIYIFSVVIITIFLIVIAIYFSNKTIQKLKKYRNLLELKEKYEKKLIDTIPIPLFVKNSDGAFLQCNKEFEKFFGIKEEELLKLKVDELPFELDLIDKMIIADVFLDKIPQVSEVEIRNCKGELRIINLFKSVFRDINNEVVGIIVVFMDITDIKKYEKKLKELSFKDELTGVYNKRYFNEIVEKYFSSFKRYNHYFSLIMYDIDFFKKINDTYGHATGDAVLRELSFFIRRNIRNSDILSRIGGEEFIIIAIQTNITEAKELAEKIRKSVYKSKFADGLKISISLGVTEVREDDTVDSLLVRVDKALYIAKEKGRNRVEVL